MDDRFPARASLDLTECDVFAIRKLVTAVYLESITEAALTVDWAKLVSSHRGPNNLPAYTTAIHLVESHTSLSKFLRCKVGDELLEWLGSFVEDLKADAYWERLEAFLDKSRYGLVAARKIINRGPPAQ